MLEHGVHRMKQLHGDHDQRLLARFALGLLAEINGAPFATMAHRIEGGEVERMAGNTRADARQAGRRRVVAALADDRVEADIRDERPCIGEAAERPEFADQGCGRLRANARDGLQQLWRQRGQRRARWGAAASSRRGRPRPSRW